MVFGYTQFLQFFLDFVLIKYSDNVLDLLLEEYNFGIHLEAIYMPHLQFVQRIVEEAEFILLMFFHILVAQFTHIELA